MITDAVLPFLSAIVMPLRRPRRTTEEGVILPHPIPTALTVALLHPLLLRTIAMIEDLMRGTLLILRLPAAESELLPGFAKTMTELRRLGTLLSLDVSSMI